MKVTKDFIVLDVLGLLLFVLIWFNRLPKVEAWERFINSLNSHGGNIAILCLFTGWIFLTIVRGNAPRDFWTGTAFGAFAGALLKTLTGSDSSRRTGDRAVTTALQAWAAAHANITNPADPAYWAQVGYQIKGTVAFTIYRVTLDIVRETY